jgi:hypothetical protein
MREPRPIRDVWSTRFYSATLAVTGLVFVWAGLQSLDSTLMTVALLVIGVVTGLLGGRYLIETLRGPVSDLTRKSHDLSTVDVDPIIVGAFVLPLVMGGLLLLLLATGNLGP